MTVAGTRVHSAVQVQALGLSSETIGSARREQFQDHFSQLPRDEQTLVLSKGTWVLRACQSAACHPSTLESLAPSRLHGPGIQSQAPSSGLTDV